MKNIIKRILGRHDYLKHFFVGFFIFEIAAIFLGTWYGFLVAILFACAKEWGWDALLRKGTPDVIDALYTILPGAVITTIYLFSN